MLCGGRGIRGGGSVGLSVTSTSVLLSFPMCVFGSFLILLSMHSVLLTVLYNLTPSTAASEAQKGPAPAGNQAQYLL